MAVQAMYPCGEKRADFRTAVQTVALQSVHMKEPPSESDISEMVESHRKFCGIYGETEDLEADPRALQKLGVTRG